MTRKEGVRVASLTETLPELEALPFEAGVHRLVAAPGGPITALSPYRGAEAGLLGLLGAALPAPGKSVELAVGLCLWAGHRRWLLTGPAPEGLAAHAALTDLSDAFVRVHLVGPAADAVLARLVPIDLRATQFGDGAVALSLLGQISVLVHRGPPGALALWLPRSMAGHAVADICRAMRAYSARSLA
jgi:heterotetrameric sarcosine oxidase gamma subunit